MPKFLKDLFENISNNIKPKKILSYALLLALVAFILVLTWFPLVFDLEHLDFNKWFTNSLISMGIMIAAIILGEIFGEDKQKENLNGLYQKALKKYNDLLEHLTTNGLIVYFSQFYIWFTARELRQKKEAYLVENGFDQLVAHLIINHIERDDIEEMRKGTFVKIDPKTGKEYKFLKIHDDEYEVLKEVYSTEFKLDAPKYTYFLSAFGDSSSVSTVEQAKKLEKKEKLNKTFNRTFKITLSLFISLIWGMASVQELTEGGVKEAVVNSTSRTIALIGGLLSGIITSVMAVKLASQKLDNKTQVLKFMEIHKNNGDFIPKSYEEIVDEEIKREQEEKEKVIVPDVVTNVVEQEKDTSPLIPMKGETENGC